jgi:dihydrofolate reductase
MRKVYWFNLITMDGYFAGTDGSIDWHQADAEFDVFAEEQLAETGTIVFGRVTAEMMAGFWPTEEARHADPVTAKFMNDLPKLYFSHHGDSLQWQNLRRAKGLDDLRDLRSGPGRDIAIFGSANLAASLLPAGLIDEVLVLVNPVVLGNGRKLVEQTLKLRHLATRRFRSGNVLLTYEPLK